MLFKEIVDARTDARTDDGRRTPDIEGSQKLTEHFVLRWAKKNLVIKMYSFFLAFTVFSVDPMKTLSIFHAILLFNMTQNSAEVVIFHGFFSLFSMTLNLLQLWLVSLFIVIS